MAREGIDIEAAYVADVAATIQGGADNKVRYADNFEAALDADLGKLVDFNGVTVHVDVLGNFGARPNDSAATLEGVDNIEVGRAAVRLFELWAEKAFSGGSLRVGMYDLNSEFYATDSAGLLIAPPFGIGSEFAATGNNGPSIFPSTGLAARIAFDLPVPAGQARFAILNANARTLGDPGAIDVKFGEGVLLVGEIAAGERLRASVGGWTYTKPRDAAGTFDADGTPLRERPAGAYAMLEMRLSKEGSRREVTAFLRGGLARGLPTTFANSVQAGFLVSPAIIGHENSNFSLGYHQAKSSKDFRRAEILAGSAPVGVERVLEITFVDTVAKCVSLQPDVQFIQQTIAGAPTRNAIHTTLRLQISF
jgi:porin